MTGSACPPFTTTVWIDGEHGASAPLPTLRSSLLRRLLLHRRLGAGYRRPAHVAGLRLVVAADAVHGLAVVPHHEVMQRPFMDVDECRLCGVLGEIAQQAPRFGHAHAFDGAGMR